MSALTPPKYRMVSEIPPSRSPFINNLPRPSKYSEAVAQALSNPNQAVHFVGLKRTKGICAGLRFYLKKRQITNIKIHVRGNDVYLQAIAPTPAAPTTTSAPSMMAASSGTSPATTI